LGPQRATFDFAIFFTKPAIAAIFPAFPGLFSKELRAAGFGTVLR
jgi:hypothetical protein